MSEPRQRRRGWPVPAYLAGLVALSLAVAGTAIVYTRSQADGDARKAAERAASFGAHLGAREIGTDLTLLQTTVGQTAANPHIGTAFERPEGCSLSFGGTSVFATGHLDLIGSDGSVLCTSRPPSPRPVSYARAGWLAPGAGGQALAGPLVDAATGKQTVVAVALVAGHGVVAGFGDLDGVGPGLTDRLGGPARLEFLVATADGSTALTRSIEAGRWTGAPLTGTPFALAGGSLERPDVDGRPRIYGEAAVDGVGWKVYAGADRATALAAAHRLFRHGLVVILVGLLVTLLAAFVVHRRITRPIQHLSRLVRGVDLQGSPGDPGPVEVRGPAEVVSLAEDFNGLLAAVSRELAGRLRAEDAAKESDLAYRRLFEGSPLPMWIHDRENLRFLEVNTAAVRHYGYTRDEFLAMTTDELLDPAEMADLQRSLAAREARERSGPWPHRKKDQTVILTRTTSHDVTFDGRPARFALVEDITETERVERHLRQTQRLESLGHLAGGVAHDFNNLLGVILNYAALVGEELNTAAIQDGGDHWAQAGQDVRQIQRAADRAVDLTRQLLSFARRDVTQPTVLRISDVVTNVEELLRRTLGEHILLGTSLAKDIWPVRADAGQLEQVLLNLTVNARDAMPGGGTLTIETKNVDVDQEFASTRPGLTPGPYARLSVSDTGTGIDADVLQYIFEPFYTTKAKGEGTGLGLATVFGIVLQAGGDIQVYTEPGIGTSFRVLFPATHEAATEAGQAPKPRLRQGGETVLVVEDEDALREVTERILARNGYQVIAAASGPEALELVSRHTGDIHLVVTDVVMPRMLGKELAEHVRAMRPGTPVLFVSGYAQPILGPTGNLETGAVLLEKPFTEASLLEKVGGLLDAAPV